MRHYLGKKKSRNIAGGRLSGRCDLLSWWSGLESHDNAEFSFSGFEGNSRLTTGKY